MEPVRILTDRKPMDVSLTTNADMLQRATDSRRHEVDFNIRVLGPLAEYCFGRHARPPAQGRILVVEEENFHEIGKYSARRRRRST